MKLEVPFYKSECDNDCGPNALRMVLAYFGKFPDFSDICTSERQLETGMVWTAGIAIAAKSFGCNAEFYSINIDSPAKDLDFYKKYANDKAMTVLGKILEDLGNLSVPVVQKNMALEELLSRVTQTSVPIVLLNWHVVRGKPGFFGHIVPVTGYDDKAVYVHNPGILDAKPFYEIPRNIFEQAWADKGTDRDVVIISKP